VPANPNENEGESVQRISPDSTEKPDRSPKIARRSRPQSGLLAVGPVVAVGASATAGRDTQTTWIRQGPVPLWVLTTLTTLLVLQWTVIAVIAVQG